MGIECGLWKDVAFLWRLFCFNECTPAPRLVVNSVKDGCGRDCALSWVVGSSVRVKRYWYDDAVRIV